MRDLKVYIRPEEMVRQNLLPYENEEYLMFECDLSPYSQAIEDTRLQFSAEGTATFMLDDDYIAHKELSSVGAIENDHNVTLFHDEDGCFAADKKIGSEWFSSKYQYDGAYLEKVD